MNKKITTCGSDTEKKNNNTQHGPRMNDHHENNKHRLFSIPLRNHHEPKEEKQKCYHGEKCNDQAEGRQKTELLQPASKR